MQESCHTENKNQFEFGNRLNCGAGDRGSIVGEANLPLVDIPMARRLKTSSDVRNLLSG